MESASGHRAEPSGLMGAPAALGSAERRRGDRQDFHGWLVLCWHHRPDQPMRLPTIDVSETGARVRTTCCLAEGMTGSAVEIVPGAPAGVGDDRRDPIPIRRTFAVVWSRAVRRDDGRLDHFEAGLRFL